MIMKFFYQRADNLHCLMLRGHSVAHEILIMNLIWY